MKPSHRLCLLGYRIVWRLALPPVSFLAWLDARSRLWPGWGFLPRNWRVTERIRAGAFPGGGLERSQSLWMHCASLGEAKGMWAFAHSLTDAGDIILTANTAAGAAFLERQCGVFAAESPPGAHRIRAYMAPFDHPSLVRGFLARHGVLGLCLYEMELWPHYLAACRERDLPVVLLSGRLTRKSMRAYRRFGGMGARLLDHLDWIQAQSGLDMERFRALTDVPVVPGFDFKAAHYLCGAEAADLSRARTGTEHALPGFAFVSLHLAELDLLLPGLVGLLERFRVLVFPRRMEEVDGFRARLQPLGFALRSHDPGARNQLVDSLGLVGPLLRECRSAFVGGSLIPVGCHNLWEPLAAGLKIHLGPYQEGQETLAALLRDRWIAETLRDPAGIAACRVPGAEIPVACRMLDEELRERLQSALADGGRRIFVTFYRNVNARTAAEA